jgi:hypothetical protein
MGRELRRVPENWEHPKKSAGVYRPMYDESYIEALNEWIKSHNLWESGKHPDQIDGSGKDCRHYANWAGDPPDVDYYRPDWKEEEMSWYQVYETVSEGTPVSPPFKTQEELIDYLVENGDFWDQERRKDTRRSYFSMSCDPWSRKQAESFVMGSGWAPSGIIKDGKFMSGVQGLAEIS